MQFNDLVAKALAPTMQRVRNMIFRAVINFANENGGIQVIQVRGRADETHEGVERFQNYGFTAIPPANSQTLILSLGGNTDHAVAIGAESNEARANAITISNSQDEDGLLYTTNNNFIRLEAENGKIYIDSPNNIFIRSSETLRLEGKNIEMHADQMIKWDVSGRGYNYYPTHTDTYANCTVPGSTNDCAPPEHPPAPSETPLNG